MASESSYSNMNGRLLAAEAAAVTTGSRGLMYGDGCFETFCSYHNCFFKLKAHVERLKAGLAYLQIDYPKELELPELKKSVHELLKANMLSDQKAVIRLQVWRNGSRGYASTSRKASYAMQCMSLSRVDTHYRLATVGIKRIPSAALPSHFKFSNGLNYILAASEARAEHADDALMETITGVVSETTIGNIFWIKGNNIYTPSDNCDILPGITRQVLIQCIESMPGPVIESGQYSLKAVKEAEAMFICNSVRGMVPVTQLDNIRFARPNTLLEKLQKRFNSYLKNNLE